MRGRFANEQGRWMYFMKCDSSLSCIQRTKVCAMVLKYYTGVVQRHDQAVKKLA